MREVSFKKRKGIFRFLFVLGLCILMAGIFSPEVRVEAASKKAVAVKTVQSNGRKERLTVRGVDKKGKTVWQFRTKSYSRMQCSLTYCLVKGKRVYVFESGKVTALNKSTGKKIWTCKKITKAGYAACADGNNNIYVTGFLDDNVYKINSKGKIVWKTDVAKTGNYWAYKMKYQSGKVTVTYDAGSTDYEGTKTHKVILKSADGKILKYN